jgi:hypothetical protein
MTVRSDGYSFSARVYLGPTHLRSAAFMARQASLHQVADHEPELWACASGAVIFSALSLEAMINELTVDVLDSTVGGPGSELNVFMQSAIRTDAGFFKGSSGTLCRVKRLLEISSLPPYDPTCEPYESVHALFKLRNALAHYKPTSNVIGSTIPENPVTPHKLQTLLLGRFALNPKYDPSITPGIHAVWLQEILCHGASAWAVETAKKFYEDYYERLSISPPFASLALDLTTS